MTVLQESVARAIADAEGVETCDPQTADAAIGVVLAEAEKALVLAFSYELTHGDQARGWALRRAVGVLRTLEIAQGKER